MTASGIARRTLVVSLALLSGVAIYAQTQTAQKPFKPTVGQEGKDVVWVPTPQALVDKMLDMAKVTKQDYVMDLGSGDGRTVITAAKRGARAVGIEYNPEMVDLSIHNAEAAGVSANATFMKADLFETDFSKATVITMFLLTDINLKLRPKLLDLKPGTRIVSNSFDMGDWTADERATITENCTSWCTALLWIVPAKVNGTWKLTAGTRTDVPLKVKQQYQMITGTLGPASITNGRLRGSEISFSVGSTRYTGIVAGNTMEGKTASGQAWKASK